MNIRKLLLSVCMIGCAISSWSVGNSGMYQWSVQLNGYVSTETGKAPNAYLWIPSGCEKVKAVVLAQQNMTEETIFRMHSFQERMRQLDVALLWVAPAFSNNWDPSSGCQSIFDEMMTAIAYQSGHLEIAKAPVVPLGHSAQATFPWNFAAWNPDRTLCIISFHGDAPRTNLCGYGTANVEWGRTRNIDGIPGLMVEGEYEWWNARVLPALAFRMMYPESCISFLCDTGRGHFDCSERTAGYIATFIQKSMEQRLQDNGSLKKVDMRRGWLLPAPLGGDGLAESAVLPSFPSIKSAPYSGYKGDSHVAFWYFDREMASLTEQRYGESRGKKKQYVGFVYNGSLVRYNNNVQGGMRENFISSGDSITIHIKAVYTDSAHTALSSSHSRKTPHIEVVSGPIRMVNDTTFRLSAYEAGWDNNRRAFNFYLVAVGDGDDVYKGCVQPINIVFGKNLIRYIK